METTTSNGEPSPRRVVNERVYVALGSDVEESRCILLWALDNFDGDFRILHVHQPEQTNAHGQLSDIRARLELERRRMHRTLDAFIHICNQAKVHAEKCYLELRDIGKGIVELVEQDAVTKLVMGAAAERHFYKGMQELKSGKAIYVNEHAHPSCQIWFVCNKHVITIRKGDLNVVDLDVTPSSLCAHFTVVSAQSNQNGHDQNSTIQRSYSSEEDDLVTGRYQGSYSSEEDDLFTVHSIICYERGQTSASTSESNSPSPFESGHHFYNGLKASNKLYDQLERAMQEAANARAAMDEMLQHQKAEKAAVTANCRNLTIQRSYSSKEDDLFIVRYERGEMSACRSESNSPLPFENGHHFYNGLKESNSELYDQVERAMQEAANARAAMDEMLRRQKAEKAAAEANCRVSVHKNLLAEEERLRKELEEALVREREKFEAIITRQQEELSDAMEQSKLLRSQVEWSDQIIKELNDKVEFSGEIIKELEDRVNSVGELLENCSKERDGLRIELDNARILTEELLRNQDGQASSSISQQFLLPEFSFSEIQEATNNLDPSMKIEDRDYGTIYKGVLHYTQVAIKMLPSDSSGSPSNSQYHRELEVAMKMRHPNLVTLIGVCPDPCSLVYEYLPNGSLEEHLDCGDRESPPLAWQTRLRIATEICAALTFLHSNKPEGIKHGDLKAENVWLDGNFVSKLCDYGSTPALSHLQTSSNLTVGRRLDPSAEFPHMDPHFLATRELSTMSDVYSFGIILLRLLTGKLAINLPIIVKDAVERGNISDLLDPLARGWPFDMARELIHLALRCCDEDWDNRPDLESEVLEMLKSMEVGSEISSSFQAVDHEEERQPPNSFICPISQDIMEEPLVAADGFSYDAESIRTWIDTGHHTSPMTNATLAHLNLVPNFTLRSAIRDWQEMH